MINRRNDQRPTMEILGRDDRPFRVLFLLGLMRSGTTFFRNLLSANPEIEVLGSELNRFWTEEGGAPCGIVPSCPPLNASDVSPEIRDRVRRDFLRFYRRRNSPLRLLHRAYRKIRYGNESLLKQGRPFFLLNKSTHLVNKVGYLRAIFPEARFLVIVREIHSQVNSLKKHLARIAARGYRADYHPGTGACWSFTASGSQAGFEALPAAWIDLNLQMIGALRDSGEDRVRWVHYEALCRDPLGVVAGLDPFLGFPLTRLLDCKPVNASGQDPLHAWRHELSVGERETIDRVIEERGDDYGKILHHLELF